MAHQYVSPPAMQIDPKKRYRATFRTSAGEFEVELFADRAPRTVNNFVFLAREGFYSGTTFHRVIHGFMAQGGDPTGTGSGGSDLDNIPAEFSSEAKFERGTCGMARTSDPNSANSQFFIMFEPAPHLNGQYTIWGHVVEGMEFVDAIKRGAGGSGTVRDPDRIVQLRVAADVS